MPLYFSYGSNMDVAAMAKRCPRSHAIGAARLMRHRLAVMREGWLTVVRDPGAAAHGLLWNLALPDVAALDRYEGAGEGLYLKVLQPVIADNGPRRALIYIGSNEGPGVANARYLASVLDAARAVPLPVEGLAALERLAAARAQTVMPVR